MNIFNLIPFAQLCIGIFFAVLFLQSGFDKVFDWGGNLAWLKGHFAKSPLASFVPLLLGTLTIVEIAAGLFCSIGIVSLLLLENNTWLVYGVQLATLSLLMLFFGQRLAKDYAGAQTIAIYFGVALISLFLLSS